MITKISICLLTFSAFLNFNPSILVHAQDRDRAWSDCKFTYDGHEYGGMVTMINNGLTCIQSPRWSGNWMKVYGGKYIRYMNTAIDLANRGDYDSAIINFNRALTSPNSLRDLTLELIRVATYCKEIDKGTREVELDGTTASPEQLWLMLSGHDPIPSYQLRGQD